MLPFGRLLADPRQEPRAARGRQAGGAHELEPGARCSGFLVGVDQAQHRRSRTGEAQFVGEQITNQSRAFPRRPARRHVAHPEMAHVERVGIDRADFRHPAGPRAGRAEALGPEHHPVGLDHQFDVAADRLARDGVVRVVGDGFVVRRGGRRGEVVDQRDQFFGRHIGDREIERAEHADQPFAQGGEFGVGDARGCRHPDRDEDLVVARVKRRVAAA